MPSIDAITQDLNNGSIVGIGAKPAPLPTTCNISVISAPCKIQNYSAMMKASLSGTNRLTCADAVGFDFNGSYLHFKDGASTIANMDVNRRIVASGNFSGCMYKIYRERTGGFKCAHIARPAGLGADSLVQLMDIYAGQLGWTTIRAVPTAGLIGVNGCAEVFIVSYLITNVRVETVRVQINNMGLAVARDLYVDAL